MWIRVDEERNAIGKTNIMPLAGIYKEYQYRGGLGLLEHVIIIKRKPGSIVLAAVLLPLLCLWGTTVNPPDERAVIAYSLANRVIVVDAGHGGFDPGAIGPAKNAEKDITLAISNKLAYHLSQAGALVISTRDEDEDLAGDNFSGTLLQRKRKDLAARVALAEENNANLFVSIHTNADVSPRWFGAQTFYSANSEEANQIAEAIQTELIAQLGNTTRKAKTGNYYITEKTNMTAVIVEVGFLSNPQEEKLLSDDQYQERVAYAVFCGIAKAYLDR